MGSTLLDSAPYLQLETQFHKHWLELELLDQFLCQHQGQVVDHGCTTLIQSPTDKIHIKYIYTFHSQVL